MGDPIPLLEELIKIDSSTKAGVNEAIAYCEQWLTDQGLPVKKLENNGFHMLVCEIGQGDHTVILNGHIDVIEDGGFLGIPSEASIFDHNGISREGGTETLEGLR